MPKIVDREQKRKEIALSCKYLFIEKGFKDISVSQIAKTAKIGKGTVYEYFHNKDEVILEIIAHLSIELNVNLQNQLSQVFSVSDKLKIFIRLFYGEGQGIQKLSKEFISILLTNPNPTIREGVDKLFIDKFKQLEAIIQEGIDNDEVKPSFITLSKSLFAIAGGFLVADVTTSFISNTQAEIDAYVDALFAFNTQGV